MSSLLVFPGQGAQRPGMLRSLPAQVLDEASQALGEDVRRLDDAQALASTRAVQLCLLIAGVAHARLLQHTPDYVAGLSIGAYPAAVIAGALDFVDAVKLVSLRGELMQQAYPQGYGMTALIGPQLSTVEQLLADVHSAQTPVYLANINADNQTVIAGSDAAMARVAQRIKGNGIAKRLAVSVPSHCALLEQPSPGTGPSVRRAQDAAHHLPEQYPCAADPQPRAIARRPGLQHVPHRRLARHRAKRLRARRAPANRTAPGRRAHWFVTARI